MMQFTGIFCCRKNNRQETDMTKVQIFTDGSARGNPDGPGGYGTILQFTDSRGVLHERELSGGFVRTTNNRMELLAAITGLEALTRPCQVDLYSDSKYLTDAFNQHWIDNWVKNNWKRGKSGPVKNIDLWDRLLKAKTPHQVNFIWVKGHAGHPENERCDKLATDASDGSDLMVEDGVSGVAVRAFFLRRGREKGRMALMSGRLSLFCL